MSLNDQLEKYLEEIVTSFPQCGLIFLAGEDGLTLAAKGKEMNRHKEYSAFLSSVYSHGKRETERLSLGHLRSAIFITHQGFFYLIPISESLMLGSVTDWAIDYELFFPHFREAARKIKELLNSMS
jgi:predicted regulator of Ras-like GTPase activity (Roadblock/LC7/MglB family)